LWRLENEIELLAGMQSLAGNVEGNFGGAEARARGGELVPAECITATNPTPTAVFWFPFSFTMIITTRKVP